jgi:hypothetical protein
MLVDELKKLRDDDEALAQRRAELRKEIRPLLSELGISEWAMFGFGFLTGFLTLLFLIGIFTDGPR